MRSKSVSPEKRSRSRSVRRARDAGEKAGGSFTVPVSHTIVFEVFMKSIALAVLLLSASTLHAQMLADPSGHWKGTIEIPNASAVEFSVDFIRNIEGNIVGTVTTGADAATLPLLSVTVKDRTVTFYARTDQPFQGQLSATGKLISGTATLSGYALPFGMMRTGDAHIDTETKSPAVTQQLEGVWAGVMADGGMEYRGRVLVGTRKVASILNSDGTRETWDVNGPFFGGWQFYHLKGSPVDPNRIYASQSNDWFGQTMQRSDDGGKTWETVGNKFIYDGVPGTHQWVRRHAASVGIQARLASRAVADRSRH